MARKKENPTPRHATAEEQNVMGLRSAVVEQPVTETLENNYMPYAMSVIVSRAIPEIDGFKPSHRKLLYCMYKMGLLTGARTKSANIVGATMHYNPHGDSAIYDTMVRLSKGYGALLTPFVDSKGNFGKVYSRDMAWAASRYTEAKLAPICAEIFRDIDKDTVDFVPNYDNSTTEPTLLPTTFPNVLVSANMGIAVGMASNICGFNLGEVCETTIALLRDPEHNILTTLPAPDFPTGGEIVCDPGEMEALYKTGRGGVKVRARWRFDPKERIIEIYEIPYSTTVEAIIDKVAELVKAGKLREISDMRDETDLNGLKLAIDVKRDVEPEKLMQKLFRMTPLQDSFACNFNILLGGTPRVCGVGEILDEWIAWRLECVRRRVYFDVSKKKEKLHLLNGLKKILLDIDRAISIIRSTERESDVVPNLMIGFGIDQVQAEYVAEIKLRNINREYILKRTEETDELEREIAELEDTLASRRKLRAIIISPMPPTRPKHRRRMTWRTTRSTCSFRAKGISKRSPRSRSVWAASRSTRRTTGRARASRRRTAPKCSYSPTRRRSTSAARRTLPIRRPRSSEYICPAISAWTTARTYSLLSCPAITAARCCSSLKTENAPACRSRATPPRRTASGSPVLTATRARSARCSSSRRSRMWRCFPRRDARLYSTRRCSHPRPPAPRRAWRS